MCGLNRRNEGVCLRVLERRTQRREKERGAKDAKWWLLYEANKSDSHWIPLR